MIVIRIRDRKPSACIREHSRPCDILVENNETVPTAHIIRMTDNIDHRVSRFASHKPQPQYDFAENKCERSDENLVVNHGLHSHPIGVVGALRESLSSCSGHNQAGDDDDDNEQPINLQSAELQRIVRRGKLQDCPKFLGIGGHMSVFNPVADAGSRCSGSRCSNLSAAYLRLGSYDGYVSPTEFRQDVLGCRGTPGRRASTGQCRPNWRVHAATMPHRASGPWSVGMCSNSCTNRRVDIRTRTVLFDK